MPKKNQSARRKEKRKEDKADVKTEPPQAVKEANGRIFNVMEFIEEEPDDQLFIAEEASSSSWTTDMKKWEPCFRKEFCQKYSVGKMVGLVKGKGTVTVVSQLFDPSVFKVDNKEWKYPFVAQSLREVAEKHAELGEFFDDWLRELKMYLTPNEIGDCPIDAPPLSDWLRYVEWIPRGRGARKWTLFDVDRLFTGENFPADKVGLLRLVNLLSRVSENDMTRLTLFQPRFMALESNFFMGEVVKNGKLSEYPLHVEFLNDYVSEVEGEIDRLKVAGLYEAKSLLGDDSASLPDYMQGYVDMFNNRNKSLSLSAYQPTDAGVMAPLSFVKPSSPIEEDMKPSSPLFILPLSLDDDDEPALERDGRVFLVKDIETRDDVDELLGLMFGKALF